MTEHRDDDGRVLTPDAFIDLQGQISQALARATGQVDTGPMLSQLHTASSIHEMIEAGQAHGTMIQELVEGAGRRSLIDQLTRASSGQESLAQQLAERLGAAVR